MAVDRPKLFWVAGVLAALLAGTFLARSMDRATDPVHGRAALSAAHQALADALASCRPLPGRLAGFPHAAPPLVSSGLSGCAGGSGADDHEVRRLARAVEVAAHDQPGVRTLHAVGVLQLLKARQARELDRAVSTLEGALRLDPTDGALRNDLAVALLTRADRSNQAIDLVSALEHLEEVVAGDRAPVAARFNRALALQRLRLLPAAAAAWRAACEREPGSGWATEAADHERGLRLEIAHQSAQQSAPLPPLAQLSADPLLVRRLAREDPQRVRLFVEEQVLADWTREAGADRAGANQLLKVARSAGEALREVEGDAMVAEAVVAIDRAREARDGRRTDLLRRGHRELALGLQRYQSFALGEAKVHFIAARRLLARGGSRFAGWASLYLAICRYYDPDYEATLAILAEMASEYPESQFPILRGRVEWMRGLVRYIQGRFGECLQHYQGARALFATAGEAPYVAYLDALISKDLRRAGSPAEAWRHLLPALAGRHRISTPDRIFTILLEAAEAAQQVRATRASLQFFDALLPIARQLDRPFITAQAMLRRARARSEAGEAEAAQADLLAAGALLPRIADADMSASARADLAAAEGEVWGRRDPARASAAIGRALDYYARTGDSVGILSARRARAAAQLAAGQLKGAVADLEAGIRECERQRSAITDPERRAAYAAGTRTLFDGMIRLQWEVRDDRAAAFSYTERAYRRALSEPVEAPASSRTRASAAAPLTDVERLHSLLPPRVAVLQYAVLDEGLLIWTIAREGWSAERVAVARGALTALVTSFRVGLERGTADEGAELAKLLLPPAVRRLAPATTLVIVPAPELYDVPFAALPGRRTATFLVQEREILLAPSAGAYLQAGGPRTTPTLSAPRSALVVANPAFDRSRFPQLSDLPDAAIEGARVARIYPGSELLAGPRATTTAFLAGLQSADVIHFAGHAVAGAGQDGAAALLVTPEPAGPLERRAGLLPMTAIRARPLLGAPLVVLGACSTAVGTRAGGDEVASLASAFLAAGARGVVASLWPVEDRATARLMTSFHRHLAAGVGPLSALRQAQLELIASDDPSMRSRSTWAGFEMFAGGRGQLH